MNIAEIDKGLAELPGQLAEFEARRDHLRASLERGDVDDSALLSLAYLDRKVEALGRRKAYLEEARRKSVQADEDRATRRAAALDSLEAVRAELAALKGAEATARQKYAKLARKRAALQREAARHTAAATALGAAGLADVDTTLLDLQSAMFDLLDAVADLDAPLPLAEIGELPTVPADCTTALVVEITARSWAKYALIGWMAKNPRKRPPAEHDPEKIAQESKALWFETANASLRQYAEARAREALAYRKQARFVNAYNAFRRAVQAVRPEYVVPLGTLSSALSAALARLDVPAESINAAVEAADKAVRNAGH